MAEVRDAALLLRRIPHGDTSLIIHLLTREHGRVALMARGARRASSPFRARLAPLCELRAAWRPGRTGMGTLTDVERGALWLPEARAWEGLKLLSLAEKLFREGDGAGFDDVRAALALLAARPRGPGLTAAAWLLLARQGWVGDLDACWQCGARADALAWRRDGLCCPACGTGLDVSPGLRRGMAGYLQSPRVALPQADARTWRRMVEDLLRQHGLGISLEED